MSVINQVLSDLEKRGVNALPGEPSVRVVPAQKNRRLPALLAAAALALALVLGMQWYSGTQPRHPPPAAEGSLHNGEASAVAPPAGVATGSIAFNSANNAAAVSAAGAASSPALVALPRAEPQPAGANAQEAGREENRQRDSVQNNGEAAAPAMRMSFELSTVPLPSSLRSPPPSEAIGQRPKPALPAPPASSSAKMAKPQPRIVAADAQPQGSSQASATPSGGVDKQIRQLSVQQQADSEFRRASGLLHQGRTGEALAGYEAALRLDAGHDAARQALIGLLLESKRGADAEKVLQGGLEHNPKHGGFAMLLARLQVERDAAQAALDTLLKSLPHNGQQADYRAFVAALLQRLSRHQEAVEHYRAALQLAPDSGVWLMGLGISLQALQRNEEARDAFQRALDSRALSAELQAYVRQRLKEL